MPRKRDTLVPGGKRGFTPEALTPNAKAFGQNCLPGCNHALFSPHARAPTTAPAPLACGLLYQGREDSEATYRIGDDMKFRASLTILVATLSVSALAWSNAHADPSPPGARSVDV